MFFPSRSLAFGACILAIVQCLRHVLNIFYSHTKASDNKIGKVVVKCFKCCLWCLHKCLKFLNKTGYVFIAMKGKSFCSSITSSFQLLSENAVRIATVSAISGYVLFLGKVFITTACSVGVYYYLPIHAPEQFTELSSFTAPVR